MHAIFHPSDDSHKASQTFNAWLKKTILEEGDLNSLIDWEKAPGARQAEANMGAMEVVG